MSRTLLFFDIDGTLIRGSEAGQTAYVAAVRTVFCAAADLRGLQASGKTDILNLRELLERCGIDPRRAEDERLIAAYLQHLAEAVRRDPGEVCPGVKTLLPELAGRPDLKLALGTGNLEQGARIKLAVHGLDVYFETGGFGSDATERADVIAAGIARAQGYYATKFSRIVVVGDTPLDVRCAGANGAHSIAVATGRFGLEELRQSGATLVLPDLSQGRMLAALESLPPSGRADVIPAS